VRGGFLKSYGGVLKGHKANFAGLTFNWVANFSS